MGQYQLHRDVTFLLLPLFSFNITGDFILIIKVAITIVKYEIMLESFPLGLDVSSHTLTTPAFKHLCPEQKSV